MSAIYSHLQVAIGNVTNKEVIAELSFAHSTAEFLGDSLQANGNPAFCEVPVNAGTEFFARSWASTTPDTFVNVSVVGIG